MASEKWSQQGVITGTTSATMLCAIDNYNSSPVNKLIQSSDLNVQTPPLQDSSTKIATTEFVAKQINNTPDSRNIAISVNKGALGGFATGLFTSRDSIAIGNSTLGHDRTCEFNTMIGVATAIAASNSNSNSAIGSGVLFKHPSSQRCNAVGREVFYELLAGNDLIGIGFDAGRFIRTGALCTSLSNSVLIGNNTRTNANGDTNEIVIGHNAVGEGSNTVVIGNSSTQEAFLNGNLRLRISSPSHTGNINIIGSIVTGAGTNFMSFAPGDIIHASFTYDGMYYEEERFVIASILNNNELTLQEGGPDVTVDNWYIERTSDSKALIETRMSMHKMQNAEFNVNGSVIPQYNAFYNLGNSERRFNQVFAANSTISTSDARTKTEIAAFTPDELNAAKQLSKEIGTYKLLSAIAEKGDKARLHVGMTVQRAIEIMENNNLNPFAYGFICFDKWDDEFVTIPAVEGQEAFDEPLYEYTENEQGEMQQVQVGVKHHEAIPPTPERTEQVQTAGELYSFRYTELLVFICRGFEERLSALENL